jgi:four helix bundle protein
MINVGGGMRDYTKIRAWGMADDLTVRIYQVSKSFPREELYAFTSQLRRAAYSVPANIAEGASRSSKRDYLHFLYIARGSLHEAHYFIHLARRLDYLNDGTASVLRSDAENASCVLTGLIRAVEKEAGAVRKTVARVTSLFALLLVPMLYK